MAMTDIPEEIALTALCVWEAMLTILSQAGVENAYVRKAESVGFCEMRNYVLHVISPAVDKAYHSVGQDFDEPFDWEFVPSFLMHAEPIIAAGAHSISELEAVRIGKLIIEDRQYLPVDDIPREGEPTTEHNGRISNE